MCEQVTISRTQLNNKVLDFNNLFKEVSNGSFNMSLPTTFKKFLNAKPDDNAKQANSRVKGDRRGGNKLKRRNKNGKSNLIRNTSQDDNFKVATGETWKTTFSKQLPQDPLT